MKTKRFTAIILDVIIAVVLAISVNVLLNYFNVKVTTPMIGLFAWAIIICKDCFDGMSIGKHIIGIQVIDNKTKQIASPLKCVSRNLFYFVSIFDVIVLLLSPENLRLGDYVTKTKVAPYDNTLQKIKCSKAILAIGYVFIGLIIMEIFFYLRASSLGLLGYLYK